MSDHISDTWELPLTHDEVRPRFFHRADPSAFAVQRVSSSKKNTPTINTGVTRHGTR